MANWLQEQGVALRRLRRVHAPAHAGVPRPLPSGTGSSTSTPVASSPLFPGKPRDRRRARRRRRRERRHRALVDEGSMTPRARDPPGRPSPQPRETGRRSAGRAPAAARGGEGTVRALIASILRQDRAGHAGVGLASLDWSFVASGGTADSIREPELARDERRGLDRVPRDARRPREDAPPAHPRRHPCPTRGRDRPDRARRAWDRAVRPRASTVPVRAGRARARRPRGGGGRDDRHRRPVDAARRQRRTSPMSPRLPPRRLRAVLAELRDNGELSHETRRRLAATHSRPRPRTRRRSRRGSRAASRSRPVFTPVFEKDLDLAYGENPHQGAAYYAERGVRHACSPASSSCTAESSRSTTSTTSTAARLLVREFTLPRA